MSKLWFILFILFWEIVFPPPGTGEQQEALYRITLRFEKKLFAMVIRSGNILGTICKTLWFEATSLGPQSLWVLQPWFKVLRVGGEAHESSEGKEFKEEVMTRHNRFLFGNDDMVCRNGWAMPSTLTWHLQVLEGAGGFPTHGTEPWSLQPEDPALPPEKGCKLSLFHQSSIQTVRSSSSRTSILASRRVNVFMKSWRLLSEAENTQIHTLEHETSILKRASFAGFAVVVRKLFAGMSLWY